MTGKHYLPRSFGDFQSISAGKAVESSQSTVAGTYEVRQPNGSRQGSRSRTIPFTDSVLVTCFLLLDPTSKRPIASPDSTSIRGRSTGNTSP